MPVLGMKIKSIFHVQIHLTVAEMGWRGCELSSSDREQRVLLELCTINTAQPLIPMAHPGAVRAV